MAQRQDGGQRDLLHQDEVVDDGKHHHEVEVAFQPWEQSGVFGGLPTHRWGRPRQVGLDRLDLQTSDATRKVETIRGGGVTLQRDDLCSAIRSKAAIFACVGADIQHGRWMKLFERLLDP